MPDTAIERVLRAFAAFSASPPVHRAVVEARQWDAALAHLDSDVAELSRPR